MRLKNGFYRISTEKKPSLDAVTHEIHVWYICLHLVDFYGKCINIPYTDPMGDGKNLELLNDALFVRFYVGFMLVEI